MFEEAMMWTHGVEFVCIAFQNRVAHAMKGHTVHSDGEIRIGTQNYAAMLESRDIDSLFTKNENKRVVIIDEVFMIPDTLFESFAYNYEEAAPRSSANPYFMRPDGERRIFGGLNCLMFGDMHQLPPIPASGALFNPPANRPKYNVLDIFGPRSQIP